MTHPQVIKKTEIASRMDLVPPVQYGIDIGGGEVLELTMAESPDKVWPISQSSAGEILKLVLSNSNIANKIKSGATVWDVGTGTGILGLALLKAGASQLYATDINPYALTLLRINASLNGYAGMVGLSESDGLQDPNGYSKHEIDIIIGNLPQNPKLRGIEVEQEAYLYNQNDNGNSVIRSVIGNAREYLSDDGLLVLSNSSRQDYHTIESDFNAYFGKGNWGILNMSANPQDLDFHGQDEKLKNEYHGQFIDYWLLQTLNDNSLRVYKRDLNGNPYCLIEAGKNVTLIATVYHDGCYKKIKLIASSYDNLRKGRYFKLVAIDPKSGLDVEVNNMIQHELLSALPSDFEWRSGPWFHNYMVICAVNNPGFDPEM